MGLWIVSTFLCLWDTSAFGIFCYKYTLHSWNKPFLIMVLFWVWLNNFSVTVYTVVFILRLAYNSESSFQFLSVFNQSYSSIQDEWWCVLQQFKQNRIHLLFGSQRTYIKLTGISTCFSSLVFFFLFETSLLTNFKLLHDYSFIMSAFIIYLILKNLLSRKLSYLIP
jgi:hypothetical protein